MEIYDLGKDVTAFVSGSTSLGNVIRQIIRIHKGITRKVGFYAIKMAEQIAIWFTYESSHLIALIIDYYGKKLC